MKSLIAVLVFLAAFLLAGFFMHQSLYDRAGIFVWSLETDADSGAKKIVRTTVAPIADDADGDAPTASEALISESEAPTEAEEPATSSEQLAMI
ncbi:MAG: hypothetical protein AAF368_04575, partial [Planctomycetota bacterium]